LTLCVKAVAREMRLQKRRKGGVRRAHMELILDRAWKLAWDDDFKGEPVDYIVKAELEWARLVASSRKDLKEQLIKQGLDPGGL
jgi:hypothetical protein